MNKIDLELALNVALKDKKVALYYVSSELEKIVERVFAETRNDLVAQGYRIGVASGDRRSKYYTIELRHDRWGWRGYGITTIQVDKTRDWRDDYYIKNIVVRDFDIDDDIQRKDEVIAISKANADKAHSEGLALVKHILTLYPNESEYDIIHKIDYIYQNRYHIVEEAMKSEKEA